MRFLHESPFVRANPTLKKRILKKTSAYNAVMDLTVLQLFVEVMRQGSFAAVARDRTLDPSSVSRAIKGLEEELGVRLFQRTTRQLSPTEAGLAYFERVEPLVEEMQQAIAITTDVGSGLDLWIRLKCSSRIHSG